MLVGPGNCIGEAQVEVLASEWTLFVVLNECIDTGKVQVVREVVVCVTILRARANPTVLHSSTSPAGGDKHTKYKQKMGTRSKSTPYIEKNLLKTFMILIRADRIM